MEVLFGDKIKKLPQKAAFREMIGSYLKENNVKVKYGYRNKKTDKHRNEYLQKTIHISFEI